MIRTKVPMTQAPIRHIRSEHLTIPYIVHPLTSNSVDRAQQLRLQDVFPLLILLRRLIRLIILPAHCLLALSTHDIPHHMPASRHVALYSFRL